MPSNVVNTQTQWREISNSIESMLRWDWQIEAKSSFLTTSLKYRTAFLHRQTQIIVITNSWKCRAKPSPKTSQIVNQYTKTCTFLRLKLQWTRLLDILCCWVFCCALHVLFERVWDVCLYSIFLTIQFLHNMPGHDMAQITSFIFCDGWKYKCNRASTYICM